MFVLHQLERSISDGELATFRGWLEREPYLLGEGFSIIQVRLIEHAVGPRGGPFIEELFARAPALERHPPPPSRVVSHAVEYGHAHLVPLLARVWPVPDDRRMLPASASSIGCGAGSMRMDNQRLAIRYSTTRPLTPRAAPS